MKWVPKLLTAVPVLQRNDWKHWSKATHCCGLLESMNGLYSSAFLRAFSKGHNAVLGAAASSADHGPPLLQGPPHQHPDDPSASDLAAIRELHLQHQRAAVEFIQSPSWFTEVWILAQSLQPQVECMRHVMTETSAAREKKRQCAQLDGKAVVPPVLASHRQVFLRSSFRAFMMNIHNGMLWTLPNTVDTEEKRSIIWRSSFRAAAVLYQLVSIRVRGFPYKVFGAPDTPAIAKEVVSSPSCMQDDLTRQLLSCYPSEEHLLHDSDFRYTLDGLAKLIVTTTFSTERLHSSNSRRAHAASSTHRPTAEHLALRHAAKATPRGSRSRE